MKIFTNKTFTGERALFKSADVKITKCVFADGESPLKESRNLDLDECCFKWKYPLWYCSGVKAANCVWAETARAGVWYTTDITVSNAVIDAPKNFRRTNRLTLADVNFTNAQETLWACSGVKLSNVKAVNGDYFAMNCVDMTVDNLDLDGNYAFDGAKNVIIRNSKLLTKDAFWNSENVTVYDSYIRGEYLGWNAKNLTLVNCTVESLQGMCYVDNLVMKNCKLVNTTRAFEYSSVEADIIGVIDGVVNPLRGVIAADDITELTLDKDMVNPADTKIILRSKV